LAKHWSRTHRETPKALWLSLNNLEKEPTCACSCGEEVRFLGSGAGFRKYVLGHAARIKNNFNTPKSMANSVKTRREMLKAGTWKPWFEKATGQHWAKGKTKENCPSIMNQMITRETPEYKAITSKRMRDNRLNGTMPSLFGRESSQWKGGTSSLTGTCHANTRLYKEWKFPILKVFGFKCTKCQNTKELQVHHDKMKFAEILHLIAEANNWEESFCLSTKEQGEGPLYSLKQKISEEVVDYHVQNNISGEVLCRECHGQHHPSLNFKQEAEELDDEAMGYF